MVARSSFTLVCSAAALAILSCGSPPDDALRAVGTSTSAIAAERVVTDSYSLKEGGQPCILPWGTDLNEVLHADIQILAGFCLTITAQQHYAPLTLFWFNSPEGSPGMPLVYPPDYAPLTDDPMLDFLAKLESTTYVVHPLGNSFTFSGKQLERYTHPSTFGDVFAGAGFVPDEMLPLRALTLLPKLPPLRAGPHTIDVYVTFSAQWCDGTGTAYTPGSPGNCFAPGTTYMFPFDATFVDRP